VRRLLIISLCLLGVGVLLLLVLRSARGPAPGMDEPEREPFRRPEPVVEAEPEPEPAAEPEPVVEAEPEPEPEPEPQPEPAAEAGHETEQMPVIDVPDDDVVAPSAKGDDGKGRMAEAAALRAEIVERVERRPLFVMAEERNVPYFRLFFMTKPELLDAILEIEHVPPDDVMPSREALERVREIAAEAYRRHDEIAAEEAELRGQASA
jgi:hypothetical protein